jgi:hypothetical protein
MTLEFGLGAGLVCLIIGTVVAWKADAILREIRTWLKR